MKRLLLLRHAKAVTNGMGGDHGRALAPRGRNAAHLVGRAMRAEGYIPDLVLVSGATRTKETWALLTPELKAEPKSEITDALYLAPWNAILKRAREVPDNVEALLVIGHNPGLQDCAGALLKPSTGGPENKRRAAMAEKFSTGALAVLDCAIERWAELAPGTAALTDFLKPRDLTD